MDDRYLWDNMVKKKTVLCSGCALARNGLVTLTPAFLDMYTPVKEVDGYSVGVGRYLYNANIDFDNYVSVSETNPFILVPTRERAIVEYVRDERWRDEGLLIEALQTYEFSPWCNLELLFEVAEFYGVPAAEMEYWLKEAREDEEV